MEELNNIFRRRKLSFLQAVQAEMDAFRKLLKKQIYCYINELAQKSFSQDEYKYVSENVQNELGSFNKDFFECVYKFLPILKEDISEVVKNIKIVNPVPLPDSLSNPKLTKENIRKVMNRLQSERSAISLFGEHIVREAVINSGGSFNEAGNSLFESGIHLEMTEEAIREVMDRLEEELNAISIFDEATVREAVINARGSFGEARDQLFG